MLPFTTVETLDLASSHVQGTIRSEMGLLTKLRELNDNTILERSILFLLLLTLLAPTETLSFATSRLEGTLPTEIGLMTSLGKNIKHMLSCF